MTRLWPRAQVSPVQLPDAILSQDVGFSAPDIRAEVTVLLATYNGADFVQAQLHSLVAQHGVGWRLLWRDDGSTDATVSVVEAFARSLPGVVTRVREPAERIGVAASYHRLAHAAPADQVLAFCDQDDVWLPAKLARGLAALRAGAEDVPALYCARQLLVDSDLRPLGTSLAVRQTPDFSMALAANVATGCTVMLNPAAAALFRAAPPPVATLHDWWCHLLVLGAGGRVVVDPEPVVLYRQHGRNLIGAPHTAWRRALAALRRGPAAFMTVFRAQVKALNDHHALLTPQAGCLVTEIDAALQRGVLARTRALRRHRLRRQTGRRRCCFWSGSVWDDQCFHAPGQRRRILNSS